MLTPRRPAGRQAIFAAVVLLHLALLWLLGQAYAPQALRKTGAPQSFWTWLRPEPPPSAETPARARQRAAARVLLAPSSQTPALTGPEPAAPVATTGTVMPQAIIEPAPAAAQAPLPPLRLNLPAHMASAPARNPAMDDPRANTPRLSFGEKLARDLGTDPSLREERLNDTTLRVRRGSECYVVRQALTAQQDPWNGRMTDRPSTVEKCK